MNSLLLDTTEINFINKLIKRIFFAGNRRMAAVDMVYLPVGKIGQIAGFIALIRKSFSQKIVKR